MSRQFLMIFWSKNDSIYLDFKPKISKNDDNSDVCLVLNLKTGEAKLEKIRQLRNQRAIAAENSGRKEILSPVLIPTMSKIVDQQLKLAYKAVDVVDRANRKKCVTLLRYNVETPKSS